MALSREELESKYGLLREEVGYPYPKIPNKKVVSALIAGCGCRFGFTPGGNFALRDRCNRADCARFRGVDDAG